MHSRSDEKELAKTSVLSYALGDAGFNLSYVLIDTFLVYYLTDVRRMSVTAVAVVVGAGRFADLLTTLVVGRTIDGTATRYGRFRPYLLGVAFPLWMMLGALFAPGLVSPPAMGTTIALWSALYATGNLAYTALAARLAGRIEQQTKLVSARFFAASTVVVLVQAFTLGAAADLGGGVRGWFRLAAGCGGLGCLAMLATFFGTRETESTKPARKEQGGRGWKGAIPPSEVLSLLVALCASLAALTCRGVGQIYFLRDVLRRPAQTGTFLATGSLCAIAACVLLPFLGRRGGDTRHAAGGCCFLSAVLSAGFLLLGPSSWPAALALQAAFGLVTGAVVPILYALLGVSAARLESLGAGPRAGAVAMLTLLALKGGSLLGSLAGTSLLAHAHYRTAVASTEQTQQVFSVLVSLPPAAFFLLAGVALWRRPKPAPLTA